MLFLKNCSATYSQIRSVLGLQCYLFGILAHIEKGCIAPTLWDLQLEQKCVVSMAGMQWFFSRFGRDGFEYG